MHRVDILCIKCVLCIKLIMYYKVNKKNEKCDLKQIHS